MTIYFYKVHNSYGCFSNFSPHSIEYNGYLWSTVEHYYQAQKFVGSKDEELIPLIRQAQTPEAAAALGRNPEKKVRDDWEEAKKKVMWQGVVTKFTTHQNIQKILLGTGEETIIEDSPTDYYWGCGKDGTGRNELGKILMAVRRYLRNS